MYRSPLIWPRFQIGLPSRRLMQWTESASGAVKTILPSWIAGGADFHLEMVVALPIGIFGCGNGCGWKGMPDRKSTRLNSSHLGISYAVFCLKKKKPKTQSHHSRHTQRDRVPQVVSACIR